MTNPVLEVTGLTVQFGSVKAVDGLDLRVDPGTLVGLIGTNGAGKTTALDALTGFVRASGSASLVARDLLALPAHKRARAGLVRTWQSLELFDDLTVRENVLVGSGGKQGLSLRSLFKRGNSVDQVGIDDVLRTLELNAVANSFPTSLSQGQRKMVVLARALALRPTVLMADEPAAGLDTEESEWLGRHLRSLVDDGLTVLLVDHDMGLVLGICDYIYVLDQGKLIAKGTPAQVRTNDDVLNAYLGTNGRTADSSVDVGVV